MSANHLFSRRKALKTLGATLSLSSAPYILRGQDSDQTLRHAAIGFGGQGNSDLRSLNSHNGLNVVAICDADGQKLDAAQRHYPDARLYQDWQELLDEEDGRIDSVNVATPDHTHAIITAAAMDRGLHCYTQKPLTRTVAEARLLRQKATENPGIVTQMGTQIASQMANVRVAEIINTGVLGKIREAWVWSNKNWGSTGTLPDRSDPIPEKLDWNNWLGPAEEQPYINSVYHPSQWRKCLDFGTGTLGDMGAHIFHPALAALGTGLPLSVRSTGPRPNDDFWAPNEELHFTMPGNERTVNDTFMFHWYDGNTLPKEELAQYTGGHSIPGQGGLIVCERGALLCPHVGLPVLLPQDQFETDNPRRSLKNHYHEWVDACLGREHTLRSPFVWGSYVTEILLLGGAATFFPGQELGYDAARMRFDHAEANPYLTRDYRAGFEIPGLPQI